MKKDGKALSSDSLTDTSSRVIIKKDLASKSLGITRPESPLLKVRKDIEAGLSIDSLADPKKKPLAKRTNKMDTSMSTDSLMTDITAITTPKSLATNKSSPVLGKANVNTRNYDKLKKSSPPTQPRNTQSAATATTRKPGRSLEGSTAASRSRAAAIVNTYHGSLNLRKSLLDAAKAPDIPSSNRTASNSAGAAVTRTSLRQSSSTITTTTTTTTITQSMRSSFAAGSNKKQDSTASPASKRSPKTNVNSRLSKSAMVVGNNKQQKSAAANNDRSSSNKVRSQTTTPGSGAPPADGPKFLSQSSRSGTFLKDEPTILNKCDIETAAIDA